MKSKTSSNAKTDVSKYIKGQLWSIFLALLLLIVLMIIIHSNLQITVDVPIQRQQPEQMIVEVPVIHVENMTAFDAWGTEILHKSLPSGCRYNKLQRTDDGQKRDYFFQFTCE